MSLPVVLRRLAQAEFDDAADWYEARRPGRGDQFTNAVRDVLADIGNRPDAHPEVYNDVREALVPGFTYAVYGVLPDRGKSRVRVGGLPYLP